MNKFFYLHLLLAICEGQAFTTSIVEKHQYYKESQTALFGSRKGLLQDSLRTITGKLSHSAEVALPDPTDPTAILLLSTNINKLSESFRTTAKANSAWIASNGAENLATFVKEQENARGSFPGPVPVIYCGSASGDDLLDADEIAKTGATGTIVKINGGEAISSLDDIADDAAAFYQACVDADLEAIPEVTLSHSYVEQCDLEALIDSITSKICGGDDPAALLLCIAPNNPDESILQGKLSEETNDDGSQIFEVLEEDFPLPSATKKLSKRLPLLLSIKCAANVIPQCAVMVKAAGFNGVVLRADCIPGGSRINPDLNFVSQFWAYIISDLKSLRSKSFGFRTKTDNLKLARDIPAEWAKLHQDVAESGALGASGIQQDPSFKEDDGATYKGF